MTGLVLKRTPELKAALDRLRARIKTEGASTKAPAKAPYKPRNRFLPGETRATVGADGFHPLSETYGRATPRRQLYNHGRLVEVDLCQARTQCRINIGGEILSPWELDCAQRTSLNRLCRQAHGAEYQIKFIQTVFTAEYITWCVGPWTYWGV